ncbi:MAG: class I SAM-dependent methyltransferase [Gammaproteobacteria bacterium]|nr:class I SAM-dependent methyltransferase [Gammaproteobacteria bacterium]CAJ2376075.1 MAG: conserved hypothetical protein [Arenicellales bacterium IbO2]MDA7960946.1 class I SAM-dependent methyltransferase [Gammaproteobacteria bacterium]MDA7968130.1 class I SAM-dependent methyltransferase [Gammaproteobacteria bacterium]MDA7994950.1 class I SAM-dependent methyltransferase [Gammaproteobacteria bacterium]
MQQRHLDYADRVNMGAYYTQADMVDIAWEMLAPHLDRKMVILDTSCGYGNFLRHPGGFSKIGNDADPVAVRTAKKNLPEAVFYNVNALRNVSREQYGIGARAGLCIVGNPPYNDRTSLIRNRVKSFNVQIDEDIQTRDLGMSFLLSYQKLSADVICILHPLSYLIKRANFSLLRRFARQYRLLDAKIISSAAFGDASKTMQFPIVIALYKKSGEGMDYQMIRNFSFDVRGAHPFRLSDFDYISNYVRKYPAKNSGAPKNPLLFWTMRDINALRRNQTFVNRSSKNTIAIDPGKLEYYMYVDVFKRFARHVPYYFGNCDVLINHALFKKNRRHFILASVSANPALRGLIPKIDELEARHLHSSQQKIGEYFRRLLGPHYVA